MEVSTQTLETKLGPFCTAVSPWDDFTLSQRLFMPYILSNVRLMEHHNCHGVYFPAVLCRLCCYPKTLGFKRRNTNLLKSSISPCWGLNNIIFLADLHKDSTSNCPTNERESYLRKYTFLSSSFPSLFLFLSYQSLNYWPCSCWVGAQSPKLLPSPFFWYASSWSWPQRHAPPYWIIFTEICQTILWALCYKSQIKSQIMPF
jgi:hypothetical protein